MKPQKLIAASTFLLLCAFAAPLAAIPVEKTKKSPRTAPFAKAAADRGSAKFGQTTVSLSGRVITPTGKPIGNAMIILMDLDGATRTVFTGQLGYYSFSGVIPGRTYIVGAFHKRFIFASPTQTLDIDSDRTDVIFLGEENF
ncbi:MAG: carboxypeptidase-like regulatory domain-containing protein [Pyrinomonadaceae bacterium]|nr:carboxypeptidase-like regulatory domain-containing protein [Pyrinomonadaceae bacterium]